MNNIKSAIRAVIALIVITLVAKCAFAFHDRSGFSPLDWVEIGAAAAVLVALAAQNFAAWAACRPARAQHDPVAHEPDNSDLLDNQDDSDDNGDDSDDCDDADMANPGSTVDHSPHGCVDSIEPYAFIPVVATKNPDNGKIEPVYELPPSADIDTAIADASLSIQARAREGMPIHDPQIIVKNVYLPVVD